MKKILLLLLVFVSSFSFSQQGFGEIIINTANDQIITRTWDVANGTSPTNVDGTNWFNSYSNRGVILIYLNNFWYEHTNWSFGNNFSINNETIGNGLASYLNPSESVIWSYFRNQSNHLDTLPITNSGIEHQGTINGMASSSPIEILREEFILNNINSLPDETWIYIISRQGNLSTGGSWNGFVMGMKKENGVWIFPTQAHNGEILPTLGYNEIGPATFNYTTDQPLSVNDIDIKNAKISIYPNPSNNLISLNNEDLHKQTFDYKIIDLQGRIIISGSTKFNNQINVESLTNGNYIIQIQTDNNEIITRKIIKN